VTKASVYITKGTSILVQVDGQPKPVRVVFDHWGDHGFMVCDDGDYPVFIPRSRLRQPDMSHGSAYYYPGPVCFRCARPGADVCVDDVTDDEYDHHMDEPRGAGYSEREIRITHKTTWPPAGVSLHGTGIAIDYKATEKHAVLRRVADGWVE